MRYSRLRPVLQAVTVEDRREGWTDLLKRLTEQRRPGPVEIAGEATRADALPAQRSDDAES